MRTWSGINALGPRRCAIYTHRSANIAITALEYTCVVVRCHVPIAAHHVVDMVALDCCFCTYARTEAELIVCDEGRPFVVLQVLNEGVAEDETADRVPVPIRSMRVELTTLVPVGDVHRREVTDTSHLDVLRRLDEVYTMKSTIWD